MRRRTEMMDFQELERFGINLRQRRTLEQISYDKIHLRRDIQELFNRAEIEDDGIEKNQAKELLGRIEELNGAIEAIEEELL